MRDYAQVLIEKCSFTYVAEAKGRSSGLLSGITKRVSTNRLPKTHDAKPHYKAWLRCFFKFAFGGYKMSAPFKAQFDLFYKKLKENGKDTPLACDCELMALCSRKRFPQRAGNGALGSLSGAVHSKRRKDGARVHRYGCYIHIL